MPFHAAGADLEIQKLGSMHWGERQWYLPGRFQMDPGTTSVHAELKPRAKAKPSAQGRYTIPSVAGLWDVPSHREWSLGHGGSQGASVQEGWGGVWSSLGTPFSADKHQTQ